MFAKSTPGPNLSDCCSSCYLCSYRCDVQEIDLVGREKWHICEKPHGPRWFSAHKCAAASSKLCIFLVLSNFQTVRNKGYLLWRLNLFSWQIRVGSKASSLQSWSHPNLVLRAEIGKVLESWICHGYGYEPAAPGEASMGHQSYNGNTIMLSPMNNGAVTITLSIFFCIGTYVKENMGIEHNYSKNMVINSSAGAPKSCISRWDFP